MSPRTARTAAWSRRKKQRGAALVEAAVVLPVLAIFLGLIMYEYSSYKEKMKVQQTSRENALYFASHGCRGGSGGLGGLGGYGPAGYTLDNDGNTTYQGAIAKGPPGADAMQGATDRSFNAAQSSMSAQAQGGGRTRTVKGTSQAYCNERPENGDPIGVIKWSFGFFRTGVL
jgi:type II secretory pathway pseudopilin PulG